MRIKTNLISLTVFVAICLSACGGSNSAPPVSPPPSPPPPPPPQTIEFDFIFAETEGWSTVFADLPENIQRGDALYELDASFTDLPEPNTSQSGYRLTGHNRSDDLKMVAKTQIGGLTANRTYDVVFTVAYAGNIGPGCLGIGGSPGDSVIIRAGAWPSEPMRVVQGDNVILQPDIGQQNFNNTEAGIALGDYAIEGLGCDGMDDYTLETLNSTATRFMATSDASGQLWVYVATDSGYEGLTVIYWNTLKVGLTPT